VTEQGPQRPQSRSPDGRRSKPKPADLSTNGSAAPGVTVSAPRTPVEVILAAVGQLPAGVTGGSGAPEAPELPAGEWTREAVDAYRIKQEANLAAQRLQLWAYVIAQLFARPWLLLAVVTAPIASLGYIFAVVPRTQAVPSLASVFGALVLLLTARRWRRLRRPLTWLTGRRDQPQPTAEGVAASGRDHDAPGT
jgi:hypothetical protein